MPADIFRVKYDIVLPGYDNVRPPSEPQGWEGEELATLATGFNHMYLWPKSQIRLGTEECRRTTPQQPPQPVQQPSQPPVEPAQPPAPEFFYGDQMAQDPAHDDNIDDDNFNIEYWIYTGHASQLYPSKEQDAEPDAAPGPSARPKEGCQVRLFGSQETPPPVAFTEP